MSSKPLVWFITGCSSGFGESLTLLALKAGHKVIATSRNPSKTPDLVKRVEALGGMWLTLDVNASNASQIIKDAVGIYGRIDVLVNNAATSLLGVLEDLSDDECRQQMDTNFFGPFLLIRSILPQMRQQGGGTIVNISSAAGIDPRPGMGMYGASKFALEGMSQALAKEVSPFYIRVLIVQPGAFTTNMMNAVILNARGVSAPYRDSPTGKFIELFHKPDGGGHVQFQAGGDVEKGCQGIFDVVTGTSEGTGLEKYIRLPLSVDCAERTRGQIRSLQETHDVFRGIWEHTGHDGGEVKSFPLGGKVEG